MGVTIGMIAGEIAFGLDGLLLSMAFLALAGIVGGVVLGCKLEPTTGQHSKKHRSRLDHSSTHGVFPIVGPEPSAYHSTHHLTMH